MLEARLCRFCGEEQIRVKEKLHTHMYTNTGIEISVSRGERFTQNRKIIERYVQHKYVQHKYYSVIILVVRA